MTIPNTSVPQATIDSIKAMSKDEAVATLKGVLRTAVKLEMATIPIYLYTYYSICRKPGQDSPPTKHTVAKAEAFPASSSLYGNKAGATIMSVAVEEMLHMSLAMNLLTSMLDSSEDLPQIYNSLMFGNEGGIVLPALSTLSATTGGSAAAPIECITGEPLEIPLAQLSLDQLQYFMRIEYPGKKNSMSPASDPSVPNWATIGEIYDYAKALIQYGNDDGEQMPNGVFAYVNGTQIGSDNYSASSIDTLSSGTKTFTFNNPPAAGKNNPPGNVSAATVAVFENNDNNDHEGDDALFRIKTADEAISAIDTICEQGEGAGFTQYVETGQTDQMEESHYYKFWSLCADLDGYPSTMKTPPQVEGIAAPAASENQITDLSERFVYNFPTNPKSTDYCDAARAVVDVANGLFQYMLIMSETTLLVPTQHQKLYFNKTMHQSMIWVMDKFYQDLRKVQDRGRLVVPTFENPFPAETTRQTAFAALQYLVTVCKEKSACMKDYSSFSWNLDDIINLPDISPFWNNNTGQTPSSLPSYLTPPDVKPITPDPTKAGTAKSEAVIEEIVIEEAVAEEVVIDVDSSSYDGTQKFPSAPPKDSDLDSYAGAGNWVRHACMGINSCKNQGRTLNNDCAGQGWCATSLKYNAENPSQPTRSDHQCHVTNDCKGQGGCGLYGTEEELNEPGGNSCQAQGSCATPINAERFITEGNNRGKSVWEQARTHFQASVWPNLDVAKTKTLPPPGANYPADLALFANGPTIEWIEDSGQGMTACGSSGMSGAGSCA